MKNTAPYVPSQYWRRMHERRDLRAVGQSGLPPEMNAWLYAALARNVDRFLRRHEVRLRPPHLVFEVGVGSGYWLPLWRSLGASRIDGCDLVPEAVAALGAVVPPRQGRFRVEDISAPGAGGDERYDLVAALNVLLHITADDRFDAALANVGRLVAPGGWLFLAEPLLLHDGWEPALTAQANSRARPRQRYVRPLESSGLRLVSIEAGTALGSNPIESRWKLTYGAFRAWWMFMSGMARMAAWNSAWLGRITCALDGPLMRLGAAPTTKFALFRRPLDEALPSR